jgi:hypothetical protein
LLRNEDGFFGGGGGGGGAVGGAGHVYHPPWQYDEIIGVFRYMCAYCRSADVSESPGSQFHCNNCSHDFDENTIRIELSSQSEEDEFLKDHGFGGGGGCGADEPFTDEQDTPVFGQPPIEDRGVENVFVLRLDHDIYARYALLQYAESIKADNPVLSDELCDLVWRLSSAEQVDDATHS